MNKSLFSAPLWLSTFCILHAAACGSAQDLWEGAADKASDLVQQTDDLVSGAVRAANDYIEADQLELRRNKCTEENGIWVDEIVISPCEQGVVTLTIDGVEEQQSCEGGTGGTESDQCMHRDPQNLAYFNDGPSTPPAIERLSSVFGDDYDLLRWSSLLWPAAVNHDYCYHHNGATYGLNKADCDAQMLSDISAICALPAFAEISWFDPEVCRKNAAASFAMVRACGDEFFEQLDSRVHYPAYRPLWQQFGLESDPSDPDLAAQVDELVDKYNICQ
ncbi:MAG: hypothetical protein EOO40_04160 [Deltaproteobacteria bacterium]|nr:MAG: hypothetical protein EOO40_04160 [Deltaproteobacteria bacterium]